MNEDTHERVLLLRSSHFYGEEIQKREIKIHYGILSYFERVENDTVIGTEPLSFLEVPGRGWRGVELSQHS